jgi:menaquinone-dependent protoporphyrinogen oxidase
VSVSLTAADDSEEARTTTWRLIDDFIEETGWTPRRSVAVAGALQYLEYDVFTRTLMRLMMRRGGHPTDAFRDYVYTDWDAVERFAREVAAMAAP